MMHRSLYFEKQPQCYCFAVKYSSLISILVCYNFLVGFDLFVTEYAKPYRHDYMVIYLWKHKDLRMIYC